MEVGNEIQKEASNVVYLYLKAGKDWSKVNASEICGTLENWDEPYEAWKDLPREVLDYIRSLPEFDAVMFKRITGIGAEEPSLIGSKVEVKINGKTYHAVIEKGGGVKMDFKPESEYICPSCGGDVECLIHLGRSRVPTYYQLLSQQINNKGGSYGKRTRRKRRQRCLWRSQEKGWFRSWSR